ncbi:PepSY-associated TM helix domain-containing protein [Nguyenibacter sp. L1]|uniref:PepSY-associated TM helix domain-containing protein n=1 Tax=Nguyenibacter sp. L1 TaxID=3049350 RepID=UPI0038CF549E
MRPASELVARVLADHPSWRVVRFAMQPHSGEALRAVMVRTPDAAPDDVFIDPRDGGVTGTRTRQAGLDRAHAMQWLYDLHATLALGTAGRLFMGAIATCWLGLTVIGLAITLPRRRPLLAAWQPAWRLNRQTLGRRPWPELHRVIGLWTIPFMIVMALTSVAMNFFDEAFVPVATFLSPPRAGSPFADDAPPPAPHAGPLLRYAIAEAIARTWAAHAHPDMQPVALTDDPLWRIRLGGPRQRLCVDILTNVRQLAVSNGDGEDPVILPGFSGCFYCPRRGAGDHNPVALRHVFGRAWV